MHLAAIEKGLTLFGRLFQSMHLRRVHGLQKGEQPVRVRWQSALHVRIAKADKLCFWRCRLGMRCDVPPELDVSDITGISYAEQHDRSLLIVFRSPFRFIKCADA